MPRRHLWRQRLDHEPRRDRRSCAGYRDRSHLPVGRARRGRGNAVDCSIDRRATRRQLRTGRRTHRRGDDRARSLELARTAAAWHHGHGSRCCRHRVGAVGDRRSVRRCTTSSSRCRSPTRTHLLAARTSPLRRVVVADRSTALIVLVDADDGIPHVCTSLLDLSGPMNARWHADAALASLPVQARCAGSASEVRSGW